jgi:hypothetical protein
MVHHVPLAAEMQMDPRLGFKKKLIETTNPNALFKSSRRRRVPTEQFESEQEMLDRIKKQLLQNTLA